MSFQRNRKILFIVQTGYNIGLGHLYRMKNLIETLPRHYKPFILILKEAGFSIPPVLPQESILNYYLSIDKIPESVYDGYTLLIIDIYNITEEELNTIRNQINIPIILFGYSGRKFENTLIVNVAEGKGPSPGFVNENILEGPDFFIPNAFLENARNTYHQHKKISNILCVFGGTDPGNLSKKLIELIIELNLPYSFYIVSNNNSLKTQYIPSNINIIESQNNLPSIFHKYDFLITSPGNIYFEAMIVGIPLIAISQSEKQNDDFEGYHWIYKIEEMKYCLNSLEEIQKKIRNSKDKINPGSGIQKIINYINLNCQ